MLTHSSEPGPVPGPGNGQGLPTVEMRGITVTFPGVLVLDAVSMRLLPGEVHALLGENGAGKSTLIKALTGVHRPVAGEILLRGQPVTVRSPAHAQSLGISTVHQEINLATNLSVAENVMLGRERRRFGAIDRKDMRRRTAEVLAQLHLDVDPGSPLASHSLAVQQLVSIARAVQVDAQVLVLDEPTSSLDAREVDELFEVIDRIRASGVAVLFVSHFLDQVYRISDRITVLRNGLLVGEHLTAELPRLQLVSEMLGRSLDMLDELDVTARSSTEAGAAPLFLEAKGLGRASIGPIDLELHSGEIVGLAGLLGSGRTEIARLLYGADRAHSGTIVVEGQEMRMRSPHVALGSHIAFSSENRRSEGLIGDLSVRANIVLAMQSDRGWARAIPRRQQAEIADRYIKALDIRPTDPEAIVRNLSGGNQQKVLLARWLLTAPKLLILDEPTRGIDVGAKAEIQRLITSLAEEGMSVLFISAELEEVVRLSHRIVVMRDRHKVAEVVNRGTTVNDLVGIIAEGADPSDDEGALV
jgi:galactofuranose transport system ATP-binding protein